MRRYTWLAPSDTDLSQGLCLSDPSGLFIEQKGFVLEPLAAVTARTTGAGGAGRAKKVLVTRKLTLTLLAVGSTPDVVGANIGLLNDLLEAAYRGSGSDATGPGIVLWMRWGDMTDWTFFDVVEGSVGVVTASAFEGNIYRLTAALEVLPYGRGRAMRDPVITGLTPETGTIYRANVPGDADALCSLSLTDTGTLPIEGWRVGRHGHPLAQPGDCSPYLPVSVTLPVAASFTRLVDLAGGGGAFDAGRWDIIARVAGGATPLSPVTDLDGTGSPTGGGLSGGSYEYVQTSFDLAGRESAASNLASLFLPAAAVLARPPMVLGGDQGWAGPEFLGGGGNVPHQLGVEGPGVAEFRAGQGPSGQTTLHLASISDGWLLGPTIESLIYPDTGAVDDQTYLSNKDLSFTVGGQGAGEGSVVGAIGETFSRMTLPFLPSTTGITSLQYKLRVNALDLSERGAPIFLPYLSPLRLFVTKDGWWASIDLVDTTGGGGNAVPEPAAQWQQQYRFVALGAPAGSGLTTLPGGLPLGEWVTVELLVDGRDPASSAQVYLNGVLAATLTGAGTGGGNAFPIVYAELVVTNILPYYTYCRRISPDASTIGQQTFSVSGEAVPLYAQYGCPVTTLAQDLTVIEERAQWTDPGPPPVPNDLLLNGQFSSGDAFAFQLAHLFPGVQFSFVMLQRQVVRTSVPRFLPYSPPGTPDPYSEYYRGTPGPLAEGQLPALASADIDICDVLVADGYIGAGGGATNTARVDLSWTAPQPGASVSRQRIYRRRDDQTAMVTGATPYSVAQGWAYQDLPATADSFADVTDTGWIPGAPPNGTPAVQGTLVRAGAAVAGTTRRFFLPAVQCAQPGSTPGYLDLGEAVLPPVQPPQGGGPSRWTLSLEARTGSDNPPGPASVALSGVWRLSHDEPQLWAQIGGEADGGHHAWDLVTPPDTTRSYALLWDATHTTPQGSATLAGAFTLSPGQNWVTILPEGLGGSAGPGMQFTAQLEITPRFAFSMGLDGTWLGGIGGGG